MSSVLMIGLQKLGSWMEICAEVGNGMGTCPLVLSHRVQYSIVENQRLEGKRRLTACAFLRRSPADWAAEAAGFLLCLPSEGHSSSSLAVPLQCGWDHSAHPSPAVMRRPLPSPPPPFCFSLCVVACHISLPVGSPMLTGRAWAWVTINISLLPFTCLTHPAASL